MMQNNRRGPLVGTRTNGAGGSISVWPAGFYSEALSSNTKTLVLRREPVAFTHHRGADPSRGPTVSKTAAALRSYRFLRQSPRSAARRILRWNTAMHERVDGVEGRNMKALVLVLGAALGLGAADISGKWSGIIEFQRDDGNRTDTAYFDLKQTGTQVTGSAGPSADQLIPLKNAKFEADTLSFEAVHDNGDISNVTIVLRIEGDRLKGDVKISRGGETRTAKLDVKKAD
jgi:hypothetical protein